MKAASIHEIKQELLNLQPKEVLELCLRLTRYKKENKELLSYLLFDSNDPQGYILSIKNEIDEQFEDIPMHNTYLAKKALRKILKSLSKYSKHTGLKQVETELLIYFCKGIKQKGLPLHRSVALTNLFTQQLKKINNLLETLHEDLKFDYKKQLDDLY